MLDTNDAVSDVAKLLNESIAKQFDEVILLGLKKGKMSVTALGMNHLYMIGVLEIAKYNLMENTYQNDDNGK
jgi:hypothetical protein